MLCQCVCKLLSDKWEGREKLEAYVPIVPKINDGPFKADQVVGLN